MKNRNGHKEVKKRELSINLALVGGGSTCKALLELLQKKPFPYLDVNILNVCDVDPDAEGILLAREMGIPTSTDYRDIMKLGDLDGVIELTNNRNVLLELIRMRSKGVWVLDHSTKILIRNLFRVDRQLRSTRQQVALEKTAAEVLLHQTNEAILLLTPDYTILDANEGYLRAVNRPREEAVGRHCYEIIYGFNSPCSEWQPEMECPMLETLRTGQRAHVIHEQRDDSGRMAYCSLETYPVKDDAGKVARVIEIRRDITEELPSRWEMRLKELKSNMGKLVQEDRMLSLGKLSASCAHELNNPIQGLLTFAHLMKSILADRDHIPEDLAAFQEYLDLMCSELERCGYIVSGLLSFARESRMETAEIDLKEVIQSVISLTRHHMQLQDIDLKVEELSEGPLTILGDVNQIQQCLLNLIFNAIEAMPGGGPLLVSMGLDEEKSCARIVVRDSGTGIPGKNMDKIFDPFFTTKQEGQGTGLGLSITYGIVKGHDGRILVESEGGKGATFTLEFPLSNSLLTGRDATCLTS